MQITDHPKPRQKPKPITCGTCRHFKSTNDEGGDCRRYPPTPLVTTDSNLVSAFPGVRKADIWCGEWAK